MPSIDEALDFQKKGDFKWVDLHFTSMNGEINRKTIPARDFGKNSFEQGIEVEPALAERLGFADSRVLLVPDPDSFARVPWDVNSTLRFICSLYTAPERERFVKDPRYCVERLNMNAKAMGAGEVAIGAECEFYLVDNVNPDRQGFDQFYTARTQIAESLEDYFRYTVSAHGQGRSQNGQQRIRLGALNAKIAADALVTLKHTVKSTSLISNTTSTFMALPTADDRPNGLNIFQKLQKSGENLFYDAEDKYAKLSQTALYYIGGILEHAESLALFTASTTNSYKKLRAEPKYAAWGKGASCLVQIPDFTSEESRFVAYTASDPSANPYISYAAIASAGLDGIKSKASLGKAVDEAISSSSKAKDAKAKPLPQGIMESVSALESDSKFLKGIMSSELLADYLEQKISEHQENERRPTTYEMEKYFAK